MPSEVSESRRDVISASCPRHLNFSRTEPLARTLFDVVYCRIINLDFQAIFKQTVDEALLRLSLSLVLSYYPWVAGRIQNPSKKELKRDGSRKLNPFPVMDKSGDGRCVVLNNAGVWFRTKRVTSAKEVCRGIREAISAYDCHQHEDPEIDVMGQHGSSKKLPDAADGVLLPPAFYCDKLDVEEILRGDSPMFSAQLTYLPKIGSDHPCVIGVIGNHSIFDNTSLSMFMRDWCKVFDYLAANPNSKLYNCPNAVDHDDLTTHLYGSKVARSLPKTLPPFLTTKELPAEERWKRIDPYLSAKDEKRRKLNPEFSIALEKLGYKSAPVPLWLEKYLIRRTFCYKIVREVVGSFSRIPPKRVRISFSKIEIESLKKNAVAEEAAPSISPKQRRKTSTTLTVNPRGRLCKAGRDYDALCFGSGSRAVPVSYNLSYEDGNSPFLSVHKAVREALDLKKERGALDPSEEGNKERIIEDHFSEEGTSKLSIALRTSGALGGLLPLGLDYSGTYSYVGECSSLRKNSTTSKPKPADEMMEPGERCGSLQVWNFNSDVLPFSGEDFSSIAGESVFGCTLVRVQNWNLGEGAKLYKRVDGGVDVFFSWILPLGNRKPWPGFQKDHTCRQIWELLKVFFGGQYCMPSQDDNQDLKTFWTRFTSIHKKNRSEKCFVTNTVHAGK